MQKNKEKTQSVNLLNELRLWLKDWRIFLLTMPKKKHERIFWFLISTMWIASWTSVLLTLLILAGR